MFLCAAHVSNSPLFIFGFGKTAKGRSFTLLVDIYIAVERILGDVKVLGYFVS